MNIFQIYIRRNLSTSLPLRVKSKDDITKEIHQSQMQISELSSRLHQLKNLISTTLQQHQQTLLLHTTLTKVLYSIRVGAQVFEEYEVSPVNVALADLLVQRNELKNMMGRAQGAIDNMLTQEETAEDRLDSLDAFIDMDDEEATRALNKSLYS
jgi:chromosome segregation ATPase